MSHAGKVAVITGSTSGIGLEIARYLAREECSVVITGLGEQSAIDSIVSEFRTNYPTVKTNYIAADLRDVSSVKSFCESVNKLHPDGIDILVNNAGIQLMAPVEEYPDDIWNDTLAITLTASFQLIKSFIPKMKTKGWGRIINMSSQQGLISAPGKCAYSTVKHGIIGLTKCVALEGAPLGITCNAICPGYVDAPMAYVSIARLAEVNGTTYEEEKLKFLQNMPTNKVVTVQEVAALSLFLCSESACNINGTSIPIEGGNTIR
ncbi:D-beta-hydroxybutyrate dehydrogenase isoform X2 [Patella vulgata]|nr:D-beta-hydroxybutyrate dehydrogenase isoform X2 [Patella vulgata]XP_050411574.1 D-beta-hydroxybutyrate dehydrogenase isoform X2 [Patella vulgata]XP_050411582.1 D-beta-hydroxybutyrate dehydrogenase isoform X2 [Patella vulgata]XP_050411590.1 D-beta-hydroxybutyrate dehydrogenase isoform X2 [Patella vulgata]